jgi:hypothetical protein
VRGPNRFFSHGEVSLVEEDPVAEQLSLQVVLPACVMQAVTPQLLGAGFIDCYEVREPLAAWIPTVSDAGFLSGDPSVCSSVNAGMRAAARASLEAFAAAGRSLRFPGDALPLLPMGTYVRFRLRCAAGDLAAQLPSMSGAAGVAELRYALASALAQALARWGRTAAAQPRLRASPGRRS